MLLKTGSFPILYENRVPSLFLMASPPLRTRLTIELITLGASAALIFALFPQRPSIVDFALALLGLLLLGLNVTFTKKVVWGQIPPSGENISRGQSSWGNILAITLPLLVLCLGAGLAIGYAINGKQGAYHRIVNPNILITFCIFIPWAFLQQTLFQFYLLGRLLHLLPARLAIVCSGVIFGLAHVPDMWLTLTTAIMGVVWTFYYYRFRILTPLAFSHALLGSAFFYWVYGYDVLNSWTEFLN